MEDEFSLVNFGDIPSDKPLEVIIPIDTKVKLDDTTDTLIKLINQKLDLIIAHLDIK